MPNHPRNYFEMFVKMGQRIESDGSIQNKNEKLARLVLFICTICYFYSLVLLLRNYAAVEWPFYGYSYGGIPFNEVIIAIVCIAVISLFVPLQINSPSSLFLIVVYIFLVLPAITAFLGLYRVDTGLYYEPLIVTSLSFSAACYLVPHKKWKAGNAFVLHHLVIPVLVTLHSVTLLYLFYRFGSIMSFANLDNLYEQRALGAAENFIDGYAQTYSQYVFSLGLLSLGLVRKNTIIILYGLFGTLVNFSITAEKAGAIYPIFIVGLYFAMKSGRKILTATSFIVTTFTIVLLFSAILYRQSAVADFIAWYLGVRSILGPGAFLSYYYDFFNPDHLTYFSHIRGISVFVQPPPAYFNDFRWPSIGLILGEDYFGLRTLNANASFVASDGIASLGTVGIPIAFAVFSLFITFVDKVTRGLNAAASCCLFFPIALTLTNGSIFTVLTSFGGIFWLIIVRYYVSGRARTQKFPRRRAPRLIKPDKLN